MASKNSLYKKPNILAGKFICINKIGIRGHPSRLQQPIVTLARKIDKAVKMSDG